MNKCPDLDPLSPRINRNGFIYIKLYESDRAYIYAQWDGCELQGYEVFHNKIRGERVIKGNRLQAAIRFPHNEAFGDWAWSYGFIDDVFEAWSRAIGKFYEIS